MIKFLLFIIFLQSIMFSKEVALDTKIFTDESNLLTINSIDDNKQFKQNNTRGAFYSKDTIFIKTFINNNTAEHFHKLIYFPRPYFGDIKVFVKNVDQQTTNTPSIEQAKCKYFIISIPPHSKCEVFASIKSNNLIETKMIMLEAREFLQKNIIETFIFSLYLGFLFFLIYSNTLNYLSINKRIFNVYSAYIFSMILFQIFDSSFVLLIFPDIFENVNRLPAVFSILLIICTFYFYIEFFQLKKYNKSLNRISKFIVGLNIIYLILVIFSIINKNLIHDFGEIYIHEYYAINIITIITLLILSYIATLNKKIIGASYVICGFTIMGIILVFYIYLDLNYPDHNLLIPLPLIASIVEFMFISYALSLQIKNLYNQYSNLDSILIKKSKDTNFGLVLDTISHQWKQPLNELGMNILKLNSKLQHTNEIPSKDFLLKFTEKSENILEFMSKTVDNFRNFLKSSENQEICDISVSLKNIFMFFEDTFKKDSITIETDIQPNILYNFKQDQFAHAILNILINMKDAFSKNQSIEPKIKISLLKNNEHIIIQISDNAGGIKIDPVDSIFDLNISTKNSGIGLYITKTIIEQMAGTINVTNCKDGAIFIILLNKTQM